MWRWLGESAIVAGFDGPLDQANRLAHRAAAAAATLDEVAEAVPGARSVMVRLREGADPSRELKAALTDPPGFTAVPATTIQVRVAWGGEQGPDLSDVARAANATPNDVVGHLTAATLQVAMIGFMPGFAYLLGLPAGLHMPRRQTPRTRVPAGSVAIAGPFCGIYPSASPGGWHIVGHTDEAFFDPAAPRPARLRPGDTVRLVTATDPA